VFEAARSLWRLRRQPTAMAVVVLVVVSACGNAATPNPTGPAGGSVPTVEAGVPGASLSPDELLASLPVLEGSTDDRLVDGGRKVRQQLVDELGLADVLTPDLLAAGDVLVSQAAAEAFPELAPAASRATGNQVATAELASLSRVGWPDGAPPVGGLFTAPSWASSALQNLWYDARTASDLSSEPHSGSRTIDDAGGIKTTIEGSYERQGRQLVADITYTVTYTVDGTPYVETTHVVVTADACPSAGGELNVDYRIDYSLTGGRTASRTGSGTATGHVGDDAYLERLDLRSQAGDGSSPPVRWTYAQKTSTTSVDQQDVVSYEHGEDAISGVEGKTVAQALDAMFFMAFVSETLVHKVVEAAQGAWRNGACVVIAVPEGTNHELKTNESFTFTARVDHKFEGGDVPLPVNAELSGDGTLVPGRIDPAPDTFVFTAGTVSFDTVSLETVSRRGRDTEDVQFDVQVVTITAAFKGTFDYTFNGLGIHGDVTIPKIELVAGSDGVFTGDGPVRLALRADIPGCGGATGGQDGGAITLTAKPGSGDRANLTFRAEESEGGSATLSCPAGAAIVSGGGLPAMGAGMINLGAITIPYEAGTYSFRNAGTAAGTVQFVVKGKVTLTVPGS
jgi:hypothetical protein